MSLYDILKKKAPAVSGSSTHDDAARSYLSDVSVLLRKDYPNPPTKRDRSSISRFVRDYKQQITLAEKTAKEYEDTKERELASFLWVTGPIGRSSYVPPPHETSSFKHFINSSPRLQKYKPFKARS